MISTVLMKLSDRLTISLSDSFINTVCAVEKTEPRRAGGNSLAICCGGL